ncbi:hypothetical protein OG474_38890 [Kribbella sp. NBC_01505]|uniref:hypothetical protein n=1 Tax=Kribbella sp. NBC_01505 TaxID=2903580 RepID=UPI00386E04CF
MFSMAGCSDSSKDADLRPLPTVAASGELLCGFVSKDSLAIVLGTTDLRGAGSKVGSPGSGQDPGEPSLQEAQCRISTVKASGVGDVTVVVEPLGVSPVDDAIVPSTLASGRSEYVFPDTEGMGYAASGKTFATGDAVSNLIVGDWTYGVMIDKSLKGRNAVDDVVALTRQVVATLNLPKVGKLPRPTATPTK